MWAILLLQVRPKPSYAFQLPEGLVQMQILNQEFWGEAPGSEEILGCAVAADPGTTLWVAGLHVFMSPVPVHARTHRVV